MVTAGSLNYPLSLKILAGFLSLSSKEEKKVLSLAKALLKEGTSPATIKSRLASYKPQPAAKEEDGEDSEGMSFGEYHPCEVGYSQDPMDDVYDDEHNLDPYKV
ncbi:hypothetical protein ACOSQ4_027125 [Xanthoceras sorbifolium]